MAIHPAYNIHPVRDPGRTGVRDDQHTPVVRPRWWKGGKEGGGDSTGCFVLTRPTTCELLPGFLPTFRVPGDFDEWCGEMYRCRGKKMRQKSRERAGGTWRTRDLAKRVAGVTGVKGSLCGERANGVGNHWTFCQKCLIFRK